MAKWLLRSKLIGCYIICIGFSVSDLNFLCNYIFQQSLHTQSKSMENSFYQESQLLQERESLSEQRRRFYQEKANFEEERRHLTESAIKLGKEVCVKLKMTVNYLY